MWCPRWLRVVGGLCVDKCGERVLTRRPLSSTRSGSSPSSSATRRRRRPGSSADQQRVRHHLLSTFRPSSGTTTTRWPPRIGSASSGQTTRRPALLPRWRPASRSRLGDWSLRHGSASGNRSGPGRTLGPSCASRSIGTGCGGAEQRSYRSIQTSLWPSWRREPIRCETAERAPGHLGPSCRDRTDPDWKSSGSGA